MKTLVRLWKRPSYDGSRFSYSLIYYDQNARRRQKALGHADARKAERQRAQLERELRMGVVEPGSMKPSEFLKDSLERTRGQVRESTLQEMSIAMKQFSPPNVPIQKVRVYTADECDRLLTAARQSGIGGPVRWDLLILTALSTAMRRGELLNSTWRNIDFDRQVIEVSPKKDTDQAWEWHIKDSDRRRLPLTDQVVRLLVEHQLQQAEGYPYVFVPQFRYDYIQQLRKKGKWTVSKGRCPVNNFNLQFSAIRSRAGVADGEFHDLRSTCLSEWLANGLAEHEVMLLAGHSKFETTRRFYLAVRDDLVDRARLRTLQSKETNSVAKLLQVDSQAEKRKGCQA